VSGILAISGVFDLVPLVGTTLNVRLGLDAVSALAASPIHRLASAPSAIFAVGGDETEGFREQTQRMCAAWAAAGNRSGTLVVPEADHFSVLESLCDGALRVAVGGLERQA
jgi:arylformamidase